MDRVPAADDWPSDLARLPEYGELYRRWDDGHWRVAALDFSADRRQWATASPAARRCWLGIARFAGFSAGERLLGEALTRYVLALPRSDQRIALATQVADEARHAFFFQQYQGAVAAAPPAAGQLSPGLRHILGTALPDVAARLQATPLDAGMLVEGVILGHVVIEALLGMSNLRVMLRDLNHLDVLPGFRAGLRHVMRDEAGHVLLGLRLLHDLTQNDARLAERADGYLHGMMPHVRQILTTAAAPGVDPEERWQLARHTLRRLCRLLPLPRTSMVA